MIEIQQVFKTFVTKTTQVEALKSIDLHVKEGELFGLIGPDGAGKTTLIRILTTLLLPTSGMARIAGFDTNKDYLDIRKIVGYMPGKPSLYMDLTIEENLNFSATIFETSIEENYDLIRDIYVQIEPFKKRRAGQLSGGMKQKLALCCALIHKPKVLFLDEPTTGVDAVSRMEFWLMLQTLKNQGITVFVSTPYMDEASQCHRIALIQEGEIMTVDTPAKIVSDFEYPILAIRNSNMLQLLNEAKKIAGTKDVYAFGEYHHLILEKGVSIGDWKQQATQIVSDIEITETMPSIEDCFIHFMKNIPSGQHG